MSQLDHPSPPRSPILEVPSHPHGDGGTPEASGRGLDPGKEAMKADADFHYERRIKPDGEQTTILRGRFGITLLVGAGMLLAGLQLLLTAG